MSGKALRYAAIWLLVTFALQTARADNVAARVTSLGTGTVTTMTTQGWSFTPQQDLIVTRLGVLDPGGDGLAQFHAVGIWNTVGSLVAFASVASGIGAPFSDGTRWVAVPYIPLAAGQTYVIGTFFQTTGDAFLVDGASGNSVSYDSLITPGSGRSTSTTHAAMTFPDQSVAGRRVGPNFAFVVAGTPITRTWPTGFSPCNDISNLVACIDGVNDGDIIEVAADAIPGQGIEISTPKSFTLRAADGFLPAFGTSTLYVHGGAAGTDTTVLIDGLSFSRAYLFVDGNEGRMDVTLRHLSFAGELNGIAIEISGGAGPLALDVTRNVFNFVAPEPQSSSAIRVSGEAGAITGRISGNVINMGNNDGNGRAVEVYNHFGDIDLDVVGNLIFGSNFNAGIAIYAPSDGHVQARIVNNLISGQGANSGITGAIATFVSHGVGDFQVLNNTVAYNDIGIASGGRADLGATATTLVSNNVVAFNSTGMEFQYLAGSILVNDFNLVHGNGVDHYVPGQGTLTTDPMLAPELYALPGSPVENSGSNYRVPADITGDFDEHPRILGIVDRGAYELADGGTDQDSDGVPDPFDNCMLVANSNQRDADGDGYGNVCDGDLNNSGGAVNFADLALFRAVFGTADADADFDGSGGSVNFADLATFRSLFGHPPGPSGLHP